MRTITLLTIFMLSACSTRYINTHKPLTIPTQCNFEKFTAEEKDSMADSAGKRIRKNQKKCRIRQARINYLISKHNEAHKE